jgi:hypothetical protein
MEKRAGEIERTLLDLHAAAARCLSLATEQHAAKIGKVLQHDIDIGLWEAGIRHRYEVQLLGGARRELGYSVYCASTGLYAQAFSSLRLFLELSFATVAFSVNELEWRKWRDDRKDFSWSNALDKEEGVLSPSFVREFYSDAAADAPTYREMAQRTYRHCSQHIHGKLAVTRSLPQVLEYKPEALMTWCSTANNAAESVLYVLYCRYGDTLLPNDDGRLAATLEHSFSHLASVRRSLEASGAGQ